MLFLVCYSRPTHFLKVYCPHLVWNVEYELMFFDTRHI